MQRGVDVSSARLLTASPTRTIPWRTSTQHHSKPRPRKKHELTFEGGDPPGEHDVPVVILEGGAIAYWRPDRGGFQLVEHDPQWDMLERKVEEQRRENREWAAYMKRMN